MGTGSRRHHRPAVRRRRRVGTGWIVPTGAHHSLGVDIRIEVDGGERPPDRIRRYIEVGDAVDREETGVDLDPFSLDTGDRRYVERRPEPGEKVLVLGPTVQARGDVGMVNAEIRPLAGASILVADVDRRAAIGRPLVGSLFGLFLGGVVFGIGPVVRVWALGQALVAAPS